MRSVWLVFLLVVLSARAADDRLEIRDGGIVRGPRDQRIIALEFTADEFTEGGMTILDQLAAHHAKASFFLTGRCVRRPENEALVRRIIADGHYLGSHSDTHPLLCPWSGPRKLLVTREFFTNDMARSIDAIAAFGVPRGSARYFIPPYEWCNAEIVQWSRDIGLKLINYTPGTRSNADYTENNASNFVSSKVIFDSIVKKDKEDGLNGYLLLMHLGVGPRRTDKMAAHLGELLDYLQRRGYKLVRVDELLDGKT